jgi:hypothetical protein
MSDAQRIAEVREILKQLDAGLITTHECVMKIVFEILKDK